MAEPAPAGPAEDTAAAVAAFFDLDRTLLSTSASIAMARPFHQAGLLSGRTLWRSAGSQLTYLRGRAGTAQLDVMRGRLGAIVGGWDVAEVTAIVTRSLAAAIDPTVHRDVQARLHAHRDRGEATVVLSASGHAIVVPVAARLGADEAVGSTLTTVDGRWTGEVSVYLHGQTKADLARAMATERGWDLARCWAYSDSVTDLPLLELVGHPVAVNPDRALRALAVERGWEVLAPARVRGAAPVLPPVPRVVPALAAALLLGLSLRRPAARRRGRARPPRR